MLATNFKGGLADAEMHQRVVEITIEAMKRHGYHIDAVTAINDMLEEQYGGKWNCFAGPEILARFHSATNHGISFTVNGVFVIIFKSPC